MKTPFLKDCDVERIYSVIHDIFQHMQHSFYVFFFCTTRCRDSRAVFSTGMYLFILKQRSMSIITFLQNTDISLSIGIQFDLIIFSCFINKHSERPPDRLPFCQRDSKLERCGRNAFPLLPPPLPTSSHPTLSGDQCSGLTSREGSEFSQLTCFIKL